MNRREFFSGVAGLAFLAPLGVNARALDSKRGWLGASQPQDLVNLARYGEWKSWLNPERSAGFSKAAETLRLSATGSGGSESDAGVEWAEFRTVNEIVIRFAGETPDSSTVFLQYWDGLTALQGAWKAFESGLTNGDHLQIDDRTWTYRFTQRRTCKVRLRSRGAQKEIDIEEFSIHGPSRWRQGEIRIEWGHGSEGPSEGSLEIYNGELLAVQPLGESKVNDANGWTSGKNGGVTASLLYASGLDVDRTIVTIRSRGRDCSFLPGEAIEASPIDIADYGIYVRSTKSDLDCQAYRARNRGHLRVTAATARHEEQTIEDAYANIHARRVQLSFVGAEANSQKFGIAPDGHVVVGNNDPLSGDPVVPSFALYFETAEQPLLFQDTPQPKAVFPVADKNSPWVVPKSQSLEGDWLPIVVTKWSQNDLAFERTDFGAFLDPNQKPESAIGNEPSILISRLQISNASPVRKLGAYYVRPWKPSDDKRFPYGPIPSDTQSAWTTELRKNIITASDGASEKAVCFFDTHERGQLNLEPASNSVRYEIALNPGEEHVVHTVVPGWLPPVDQVAKIGKLDYDAIHRSVSQYWTDRAASTTRIRIPEPRLQNLFNATLQHFLLVLTQNGHKKELYPNTAMMHYGSIGTESSPIIRALDMRGLHDVAEQCLNAFLSTQGQFMPDGDYVSKAGGFYRFWPIYTCNQGGVLWALADHYRFTRDRQWLERTAPKIVAGCQFIIRERKRTMTTGLDGKKPLHYGFAPAGCVADPRDWQYSFMLNAWFYAGLINCAQVLSEIDHPFARELTTEAEDLRSCILRALKESVALSPVTRLRDNTSVPSVPSYLGLRGFSSDVKDSVDPDRRHGYAYDSTIGPFHLFNCGVLAPDDPLVTAMLNYLEDRFFLFTPLPSRVDLDALGTDWFNLGGFEKLQPYYVHYQEAYLRRDEIPNFLRGFYNTLAPIADPETLTFQEELDFGGGQPHKTHEEAWFFHQIRHMLVMESGNELHLAMGTPRRWLRDGQEIAIEKAPSHFGEVSYSIRSSVAAAAINGKVTLPLDKHPTKIVLRLRHPQALPIKSVSIQGKPWSNFDSKKEWIVLPAGVPAIEFTAHY
jgi:hypothetical protein